MKFSFLKIVLASTIVLAACGDKADENTMDDGKMEETSMKSETLVTVNGKAITQAHVDERASLIAQGGQALSKEIVLNQLIEEYLVFQDAEAKDIFVTTEELDKEFSVVVKNAGGAELLKSQLSRLNLSPSALRKDLETQLLIQKYLESEVDTSGVTVTYEEIQTAYDEIAAEQEVPPLDETIRAQIREQIELQKKNQLTFDHVQTLRENSTIEFTDEEKAVIDGESDSTELKMETDADVEVETETEEGITAE